MQTNNKLKSAIDPEKFKTNLVAKNAAAKLVVDNRKEVVLTREEIRALLETVKELNEFCMYSLV